MSPEAQSFLRAKIELLVRERTIGRMDDVGRTALLRRQQQLTTAVANEIQEHEAKAYGVYNSTVHTAPASCRKAAPLLREMAGKNHSHSDVRAISVRLPDLEGEIGMDVFEALQVLVAHGYAKYDSSNAIYSVTPEGDALAR